VHSRFYAALIDLFVVAQVVAERALKVLRSDEVESKNFPEDELITLNAEEEELGKYIVSVCFLTHFTGSSNV
jgi:hypothetical protein